MRARVYADEMGTIRAGALTSHCRVRTIRPRGGILRVIRSCIETSPWDQRLLGMEGHVNGVCTGIILFAVMYFAFLLPSLV
jgi:hypothetical protein